MCVHVRMGTLFGVRVFVHGHKYSRATIRKPHTRTDEKRHVRQNFLVHFTGHTCPKAFGKMLQKVFFALAA